jgi:hypothetical protein
VKPPAAALRGIPASDFIEQHNAAGDHVVVRTLRGAALLHPGLCGTHSVPCAFSDLDITPPGPTGQYVAEIAPDGILRPAGGI